MMLCSIIRGTYIVLSHNSITGLFLSGAIYEHRHCIVACMCVCVRVREAEALADALLIVRAYVRTLRLPIYNTAIYC